MPDSTPDSPKDLLNQQNDVLALHAAKTQIHLGQINEQVKRWEDLKDDEIFEIKIGELRSILTCWLAANESLNDSFRRVIKLRQFLDRFRR